MIFRRDPNQPVATHLAAADHVGGGGEQVDHLALALIAPLGAQHHVYLGSGRIFASRVELVVRDRVQVHRPVGRPVPGPVREIREH